MRAVTSLVFAATVAGCVNRPHGPQSTPSSSVEIVHSFRNGLVGAHANSASVSLSVVTDPSLGNEAVLTVQYPEAGNDPASRDVQLAAQNTNWSVGKALTFRVKPAGAIRLSVSFVDRNRVAYTWWSNLQADVWQTVRVDFTAIRPNPYFQPPGANTEAPINLTKVDALGFAPRDRSAGRLMISEIALVK